MKNNLKILEAAGLSQYEAKAYHALLIQPNLTATEISRLSAVPRSKVYDVLDNLINKGICTELVGKVRKFKAVNPEFAFTNLIKKAEDQKQAILTASSQLKDLFLANSLGFNPLDFVEIIRDKARVNERITDLAANTTKEICNMAKPPYTQNIEDLKVQADSSDLDMYYLYETKEPLSENFLNYLTAVEKQGAKIRLMPELPLKMAIFDSTVMLLTLQDEMPNPNIFSTMILKHPKLAQFVREMFMIHFLTGISIDEYKTKLTGEKDEA